MAGQEQQLDLFDRPLRFVLDKPTAFASVRCGGNSWTLVKVDV